MPGNFGESRILFFRGKLFGMSRFPFPPEGDYVDLYASRQRDSQQGAEETEELGHCDKGKNGKKRMYADGMTKNTRSKYMAIKNSRHKGNKNRVNKCHLPQLIKRTENNNRT